MTDKFTPGPLEANARDCGIYAAGSDKLVGTARTLADATLFAAAPDLLDLLQRASDYVHDASPDCPEAEALAGEIRAAIARATGES